LFEVRNALKKLQCPILEWGLLRRSVYTKKSETQPSAAEWIEWAPVSFGTAELHRLADTFSYFSVIFKQSTPSKLSALAVQQS